MAYAEFSGYDPIYCYPESNCLINKFDIHNLDKLHKKERAATTEAEMLMYSDPIHGNFDLKHLQDIHRKMFAKVYNWAGELRTCDLAKGDDVFCRCVVLEQFAETVFTPIRKEKYFIGSDKETAIKGLAKAMGMINCLHPFREGNGRSTRQFMFDLAYCAGIYLDYDKTNKEDIVNASIAAFHKDYSGFEEIFEKISSPVPREKQHEFIETICPYARVAYDRLEEDELLPDREKEFRTPVKERIITAEEKVSDSEKPKYTNVKDVSR